MRPRFLLSFTALGLLTAAISGCASRAEVERLKKQQREIRAMVADQNVAIEGLRRRLDILRQELAERSSARGGPVPAQLQQRLNELDGRLTAIEQRLAMGSLPAPTAGTSEPSPAQPGSVNQPVPTARPQSPLEVALAREEASAGSTPDFREGLNLVRQGQCAQAAARLKEFVRKNPKSDLADNAQYWIGACYFYQRDYGLAARELSDVMMRYPKGDKAPAALLLLADSFAASGETTDAKLVLRKLTTEYPRTEEAEQAKQKLRELGD